MSSLKTMSTILLLLTYNTIILFLSAIGGAVADKIKMIVYYTTEQASRRCRVTASY